MFMEAMLSNYVNILQLELIFSSCFLRKKQKKCIINKKQ